MAKPTSAAPFAARDAGFLTACYQHEESCRARDWYGITIGGLGSDSITGGNGENIVFGDDGEVAFANFVRGPVKHQPWDAVEDTVYASAQTIYQTLGGADTISLGSGTNIVFGGTGNDSIIVANTPAAAESDTTGSPYVIFGGNGQVIFSPGGWVTSATLTFPQFTGTDTITLGSALPVMLSGVNDEVISALATPAAQMAAGPAPTGQDTSPGLTESQLQPVVVEAEAIWAKVLGPDNARLAILNGITVQVGDLPSGMIGATVGDSIYVDSDADGWGWFTNASAVSTIAFQATSTAGVLNAAPGSAAAGHMDLLSTVLHEMGNVMGFPEDSGADVTGDVLAAGTRRLPVLEGAVGVASGIPVIDWNAVNNGLESLPAPAATPTPPAPQTGSWVDSFLSTGGGGKTGPNAGLRIKPAGT